MQPYQKRFLVALKSDDRLETPSEHWIRERIESRRAFTEAVNQTNETASALAATPASIGHAARRAQSAIASFEPIARQILEAERGAPLGRKRRARRARGRRIEARLPYSSAALAMAAELRCRAERAEAFRPLAERLAAVFVQQVQTILNA
jgi:hypothetical protein